MAGQKQILNKNIYFVVGRGVRTGYFFLSRVLLSLCACLALGFHTLYLLLCITTLTDSHETPVIPELAINLELCQFVSSCPNIQALASIFKTN
ncbi:unnamed protein product [Brassica napus]|uniref:(rape) hypothetical protein n=1 Tax=Brassica napus TaxID=3708 RepID=A0A816LQN6_BRANA|nr:unnamed protein product [Brassica napus]